MAEYINKNAAYDYATLDSWYIASVTNGTPVWTEKHLEELLNDFYVIPKDTPAADVVEVKHGYWIKFVDECDCEYIECSCCGSDFYDGDNDTYDILPRYCSECGAKMNKGGADNG